MIRRFADFIKRVYVRVRSTYLVKWYQIYYGVQFGERVRISTKLNIYGYGKIYVGKNTLFGSPVTLGTTNSDAIITIGENNFINGAVFCSAKNIEIGNNCIISDCEIMDTSSHGIDPNKRNDINAVKISPIIIRDNVWIGSKSFILPGVNIENNSIIGVNSVVSKSVGKNVFAAGIPARVIKTI